MVNEFDGKVLDNSTCGRHASTGNSSRPARRKPCFQDGQEILDFYNLNEDNVTQDILILIGLAVGFRILCYVIMELIIYQRSKHTRKQ